MFPLTLDTFIPILTVLGFYFIKLLFETDAFFIHIFKNPEANKELNFQQWGHMNASNVSEVYPTQNV